MSPYSRPQLWVLLAMVALGGVGVGVGSWRRAHPDLAERVERFDAETAAPDPRLPAPGSRRVERAASNGRATDADTAAHQGRGEVRAAARARSGVGSRAAKRQVREGPLDLNRATEQDLRRLPGVGPALAARIRTAREQSGRFESVDDLRAVPGIGEAKLARLRDLVTVAR